MTTVHGTDKTLGGGNFMGKKFEVSQRSWRNLFGRVRDLEGLIRSYDLPEVVTKNREIIRKVEELKKEMTDFWIKQRNAEKVNELAPEYQETAKCVEEAAQKIAKTPFGLSGLATEFIKGRYLIIDKNTDQTYVSNKKADMRLSVGFSNALEEKEIKLIR
jgi:hypothetical protein